MGRMARVSITSEKDKFHEGFDRFNRREFFGAHESWEEIWLHAPKHEKAFLQGIIQVAAGFHHYQRSNRAGCESLLIGGLRKLERYPDSHGGIALASLRSSVRWWLAELCQGRIPAPKHLHRLRHAKTAGSR
jgi:predicted metal-dependent hydrolase